MCGEVDHNRTMHFNADLKMENLKKVEIHMRPSDASGDCCNLRQLSQAREVYGARSQSSVFHKQRWKQGDFLLVEVQIEESLLRRLLKAGWN